MQDDTNQLSATPTSKLAERGLSVTAGDINSAYYSALGSLKVCVDKATEFVERCAYTGKLLTAKKEAVGHGNWLAWLTENCPEISRKTAHRLMVIWKMKEEANVSRVRHLEITKPISSIYEVYCLLKSSEGELEVEGQETEPSTTPPAPPSKIAAAIARFWGAISRRPPEKWDKEERSGFLEDVRERARLIRENKLTDKGISVRGNVIEIEVEEVR